MSNNIVIALKGIIHYNKDILIIKRSKFDEVGASTWEFVGGKLDFGETLEEGLKREINEEVGLTVSVERLLYATTFQTSENRQVVILTYLCKSNSNQVTLSDEHDDYLWGGLSDIKKHLSPPILHDLENNNMTELLFNRLENEND